MDQHTTKAHFLTVYDQYANDIFRFCRLKVAGTEIAEDITQEVFMRFWQQLRTKTKIQNERALLYTIARNLVIDWYRKRKESSLDVLEEQGIEFASGDHHTMEQSAQMNEVLAVVNQLDTPSREVLLLRYVEGLTPKDIAVITGESANAISVRINRAIKKVQELLHV